MNLIENQGWQCPTPGCNNSLAPWQNYCPFCHARRNRERSVLKWSWSEAIYEICASHDDCNYYIRGTSTPGKWSLFVGSDVGGGGTLQHCIDAAERHVAGSEVELC